MGCEQEKNKLLRMRHEGGKQIGSNSSSQKGEKRYGQLVPRNEKKESSGKQPGQSYGKTLADCTAGRGIDEHKNLRGGGREKSTSPVKTKEKVQGIESHNPVDKKKTIKVYGGAMTFFRQGRQVSSMLEEGDEKCCHVGQELEPLLEERVVKW